MGKTVLFTSVLIALAPTCALAENWVSTPPSPAGLTAQYDADSVYVDASSSLIYVMTCADITCANGKPGQSKMQYRINCPARTEAALIGKSWSPPAHQANNEYLAGDNEYLPGTGAALTIDDVCAKKDSWPKRAK